MDAPVPVSVVEVPLQIEGALALAPTDGTAFTVMECETLLFPAAFEATRVTV